MLLFLKDLAGFASYFAYFRRVFWGLCKISARKLLMSQKAVRPTYVPIMCLIDASSRVESNHHDELDLFTFLFPNRMLLDK